MPIFAVRRSTSMAHLCFACAAAPAFGAQPDERAHRLRLRRRIPA